MPVLKAKNENGVWVPVAIARNGAQGPPGPASPHEGSHIAVSVRQYGAVGDGTTDDTAAVQAAINAAGSYGWVDFEAGTYKVTSGLSSWLNVRKTGPGVLTDGTLVQYVTPRYDGDLYVLHVNGASGSDFADGMFPHSAFKTLTRLREAFEKMDQEQVERGRVIVRLTGTITGGMRFQNLPVAKNFIRFEGDALDSNGRPTTWIENDTADGERFGLRFEEGQNMRVHLSRLGFRGFNTGGGAGWILKSGGFLRAESCRTEGCQIGSLYTGSTGHSEIDCHHEGYTTSGTRIQYNSSGSWLRVTCQGSSSATEGFHISRNSVAHVDVCTSVDHARDGVWADMNARVSVTGSTLHRNGREGVRGEGGAEIHIDDTTNGPNDFGLGTENRNGRRGVGLYGVARLTATESIYGISDKMVDSWRGSLTTARTAARGLDQYRIGLGARLTTRAWGLNAGTVTFRIGSQDAATLTIPPSMAGGWLATFSVEVANVGSTPFWVGYASLNGGETVMVQLAQIVEESRVTVTPAGGVAVRGAEHATGG